MFFFESICCKIQVGMKIDQTILAQLEIYPKEIFKNKNVEDEDLGRLRRTVAVMELEAGRTLFDFQRV